MFLSAILDFFRLRGLAERFSRNIVLKRKLPAEFGLRPIYVSPGAALAYWRHDLRKVKTDLDLLRLAEEHIHPGDIVWDVGANIGLFALASAHRVMPPGRVLALEPDTWCVEILRRSLRANKELPLEILPVAVSDHVNVAAFNIAERGRETSYLADVSGSSTAGGVRETQLVVSVSLDWLAERLGITPSFLKIDVESAEHLVLRGAETILNHSRPAVLCEVSAENTDAVTTILKRHGYVLFDAAIPVSMRTPLEKAVWSTFALPQ